MRVTIADVARQAGVSTATVDRVVNARAGVHPRTQDLVRRTALEMGMAFEANGTENGAIPQPAGERPRIAFILPGGSNAFMDLLAESAEDLSGAEATISVHRTDDLSPAATVETLARVQHEADALAIVAFDAPAVREALREFIDAGKPVLSIVSPISGLPMAAYVGVDNRSAGRLAGQLASRLVREKSGTVGLLTGNLSYRGHEEREMGFRSVLKSDAPELSIVAVADTEDDNDHCAHAVRELIGTAGDLRAVYNVGGGNRGIAQALEEASRGDIVFIGHELTAHTRRFLISGLMDVAIVQPPQEEARLAVKRLCAAFAAARGGTDDSNRWFGADGASAPALLPLQAVFRENIPV